MNSFILGTSSYHPFLIALYKVRIDYKSRTYSYRLIFVL